MNNDEYVPGRTGEPERRDPPTRRPWFKDNWYINKFAQFKEIQSEIIAYRKNWLFRTRRDRTGRIPSMETGTQDPPIPPHQPTDGTPVSGGAPETGGTTTSPPLSPVARTSRTDFAGTKARADNDEWFLTDRSPEEEDDDDEWLEFGDNRRRFGAWRKKSIKEIQGIDDDEEREKEFTIFDDLINTNKLISFFRHIRKEPYIPKEPTIPGVTSETIQLIKDIVLETSDFIADNNVAQEVAEEIIADIIDGLANELDTNAETVINILLPTIPAIDAESDEDDADVSFQNAMDELDTKLRASLRTEKTPEAVLPKRRTFYRADDNIADPAYWNWKKGIQLSNAVIGLRRPAPREWNGYLQHLESIRMAPKGASTRTRKNRPHIEHDLGLEFSEEDDDLMDDLANAFSKAKAKPPTAIRPSFQPPDNYVPPAPAVSPIYAAKDLPAILRNAKRKTEYIEEGQKFIRNRNRYHKRPLDTDTTGELRSGKHYKDSR